MRFIELRRASSSTIVGWASVLLAVAACASTTRPTFEPKGGNDAKVVEPLSAPELLRISRMSDATRAERDHYLYLPEGFRSRAAEKWPVLLFLHGNGERGDAKGELDFLLKNGPLYEAWIQKRSLPFILVVPQLPMYGQDEFAPYLKHRRREEIPARLDVGVPAREPRFETPDPMKGAMAEPLPPEDTPYGPPMGWPELEKDLLAMLDDVLVRFRGDPDRQYLSGLSYGGFGTWYLASRHSERFAAIVPVVGYAHPDLIPSLASAQMPIWCFAGGRDDVVPAKYFYAGFNRLEALGHKSARLTIEADLGHDVWSRVYAGRDVYDWLLSQRRVSSSTR
jgi:predicted peptidase